MIQDQHEFEQREARPKRPTRAERARLNRIEHWLRVRAEAEENLRNLGYSEEED